MASLQTLVAFAETARHASFAGAARELGLSPSAVAKSVARLEQDFGLRLFHRTTRQVTLTADGQDLFARCARILGEVEALRDDVEGARREPAGTLRVSVPIAMGKQVFAPLLARLMDRHPRLRVELNLTDRFVDLVRERLDAAVRVGAMADSTLVARRIGTMALPCVASPAYLRAQGTPRTPAQAARHRWLLFRNPSTGRLRPVVFGGGAAPLEPPHAMVLDDGEAMVEAALHGVGLAQVPHHMAAAALRKGKLVEVLVRHRAPSAPVSLVYDSARHVPPRLAALADALVQEGPFSL